MGHLWLNGWGIYDLMGGAFMAQMSVAVMATLLFLKYAPKLLVFKGVPFPDIE